MTWLLLIVMFWSVIAGLLGWWASAWIPPTTIPSPASSLNVLPVMLMLLAPRPVPLAVASASWPTPRPTSPRSVNVSPLKVMPVAAETCTAAGIWSQSCRVASNSWQPLKQPPKEGCDQVPVMNAPFCWSAYPLGLLGPSQVVPVNVTLVKLRPDTGLL